MSAIVKVDNNQVASLSPVNRAALENMLPQKQMLITAALQKKLKDMPALTAVTEFTTIITAVYTIAGQQPDPKVLALYADEFYTKLLHTYPAVTIEEVRAALCAGVYGEYGDYFGLNPKTFLQFIKCYLNSEERRVAKQEFEEKRLILAAPKPTTAEIYKSNVLFVEMLYSDFQGGKLLSDFIPAYVYDFLEREKLLLLTIEEKKVIKERARSYYTRLKTGANLSGTVGEVLSGYYETTKPELTVKTISKQFAIYEYFERCKSEGKEIIFCILPGPISQEDP